MKLISTIILTTTILLSPALADSNAKYLALLAQAAAEMNLTVTPNARRCVERAVGAIPDSVKSKAAELHSVDVSALQRAGVPVSDLNRARAVARPCMNQITIDNAQK